MQEKLILVVLFSKFENLGSIFSSCDQNNKNRAIEGPRQRSSPPHIHLRAGRVAGLYISQQPFAKSAIFGVKFCDLPNYFCLQYLFLQYKLYFLIKIPLTPCQNSNYAQFYRTLKIGVLEPEVYLLCFFLSFFLRDSVPPDFRPFLIELAPRNFQH